MISLQYGTQNPFGACDVAYGLSEALDRDERRALRRAERAERAFRRARGYEPAPLWTRLARLFQA